jgi:membrane associated rhomboid family serine protease
LNSEKTHLLKSLRLPLLFVAGMWLVKAAEYYYSISLYEFGIYPLTTKGLIGILTSPFIHKDFSHLLSNTLPLLISSIGIIYFYPNIAYRAMIGMYLMTGIWIWCFARPSYHIGASGLVYSFVFFLFFSGVLRKDRAAMAVSLLVTFLYGSIVWGILPLIEEVSWEAHLMGTLAGIFFAWYYRKSDGPTPKYEWKEEEELTIEYHYIPDEKKEEN